MIQITLPGNVRSKKNSKRLCMIGGKNKPRRPMALPSKAYEEWAKSARTAAIDQIGLSPIAEPKKIAVRAVAYCNGVLPDLSGMLESIGDVLEGIAWENDRQIVSWDGSRVVRDKIHQRTEIFIQEAEPWC